MIAAHCDACSGACSNTILLDESGDVTGKAYGVWGPPTAYFIDREGRLIGRVAGSRDWSGPAARAFIQTLLDDR